MSNPSAPLLLLLALAPFVFLLDKEDIEEGALEGLIAEAIADNDSITESPAEAIVVARKHLVPMRDELDLMTLTDLRKLAKPGHSRSTKKQLIPKLIEWELAAQGTAGEADEPPAATPPTPAAAAAASPKPKAPKMADKRPTVRDIKEIRVLEPFTFPVQGKGKKGYGAKIGKSLFRGKPAENYYAYGLAREKKEPGWLDKHIQVVALHG